MKEKGLSRRLAQGCPVNIKLIFLTIIPRARMGSESIGLLTQRP